MLMWTDSPGCQLDPVRVTVLPGASSASSLWIVCAGNVLALESGMPVPSPWIAGDVLPCGLAFGSAMSAPSLWILGDVLPPTAGCADIDPCRTPCICERLSTPSEEGYARIMLRGSTTLKTAVDRRTE